MQSTVNQTTRFRDNVVKQGLRNAAAHHIESFNFAFDTCLDRICANLLPVQVNSHDPAIEALKVPLTFKKLVLYFQKVELK